MKIGLWGHFGSFNTGNESTLLALLSRLRTIYPDADYVCICTIPDVVRTRYGIQALPITTRRAHIWNPYFSLIRRVPRAFVGAAAELRQYLRAWRILGETNMLIVAGTGLITDAYGLDSWGPYGMFRWVLAARLRGVKVLIVSVGAGPVDSAAGRLLVRATMSLANYRSYRDGASRDALRAIGFDSTRDPLRPDLAFSLPPQMLDLPSAADRRSRPVVGIGLMEDAGRYSDGGPAPHRYRRYMESMAAFAVWLLERGYDIRLLLGDEDTASVADFRRVLHEHAPDVDQTRVIDRPILEVEDLLGELAATDMVVVTRFHNILLSTLMRKPVIAISFHHKCSSLMDQMGLSAYCHEMLQIDTDQLIEQFQALERNQEAVKHTIDERIEHARAALDDQYDLLFARR